MKKTLTVLLSCAVLLGLAGCGAKDTTTIQPDSKPAAKQNEEIPGLFHKAESDGIEIVVKASQIKIKPGDELTVLAQIRNTTTKTLFVQTTNGCDPGVRIDIPVDTDGHFALAPEGEPKMCTEVMGVKELKPNQTIMNTVKFLAKDDRNQQNVKPREYNIDVRVNLTKMDHGMMNTEPPKVIATQAKFTVAE